MQKAVFSKTGPSGLWFKFKCFMFPYEDEYLRADCLVFMSKISAHCWSICCGFEPTVSKVFLQTDSPITRVRVSQTKVTVSNVLSCVVSSDLQSQNCLIILL